MFHYPSLTGLITGLGPIIRNRHAFNEQHFWLRLYEYPAFHWFWGDWQGFYTNSSSIRIQPPSITAFLSLHKHKFSMLAPAQRLIQLKVHLMPYKTESKVPKKDAFVKSCGTQLWKQVYDPNTGLLSFTLYYIVSSPMTSPRTAKEFLWRVLQKMVVFLMVGITIELLSWMSVWRYINSFSCEIKEVV